MRAWILALFACTLIAVSWQCVPTKNVQMPVVTGPPSTTSGLSCTTAGAKLFSFGNVFVPVSAGPGQMALATCTSVGTGFFQLVAQGVNPLDQLPGTGCTKPCTSTVPLTCNGATGQFTFIPTQGPDTGMPVVVADFFC